MGVSPVALAQAQAFRPKAPVMAFESYCAVIDCMAVGCAIDPTLVETFEGRVGIETAGSLTRGCRWA